MWTHAQRQGTALSHLVNTHAHGFIHPTTMQSDKCKLLGDQMKNSSVVKQGLHNPALSKDNHMIQTIVSLPSPSNVERSRKSHHRSSDKTRESGRFIMHECLRIPLLNLQNTATANNQGMPWFHVWKCQII